MFDEDNKFWHVNCRDLKKLGMHVRNAFVNAFKWLLYQPQLQTETTKCE